MVIILTSHFKLIKVYTLLFCFFEIKTNINNKKPIAKTLIYQL